MMPPYSKPVKVLFIALIGLASTVTLWAQGQVVEGSCVLTAFEGTLIVVQELPTSSLSLSGDVTIADSPSVSLNSPDIEISAHTINLVDVAFQPIVGDVNFISAVTYGGGSSGAEMIGLSRPTPVISTYPTFPSSPDFVFYPNQAGVLQAVPEPSTVALVTFAFGLITLARLKKHLFV
jgi:hypothetical protein